MKGEEVKGVMSGKGPVVVTGASGFVGSWLVMKLLQAGYTVRATVRDPCELSLSLNTLFFHQARLLCRSLDGNVANFIFPANVGKTKPLLELPGSKERLSVWKADLSEEGSFDEAIKGCTGVFHVATPMDFESKDPEVSKPSGSTV